MSAGNKRNKHGNMNKLLQGKDFPRATPRKSVRRLVI